MIGGDRLRIHQICQELSKSYSLTLLSLCDSAIEMHAPMPEDSIFSRIERIYLPKYRSYINSLLAIPSKVPLQVAYYKSEKFSKKLQSLLDEHDCVLAHLIRTGDYIKDSCRKPTILEMTDSISLNYNRISELSSIRGMKSRIYSFESSRLYRYERDMIHKFNACSLVSRVDANYLLHNNPANNVIVASNGVDLALLPYIGPGQDNSIVFIGNMFSVQNLDACYFFAEEVLPLLRKRSNFTFKIVGQIAPINQKRLEKYPNCIVVGKVNNIPAAVSGSFAAVCPMRIGAGVQNKVLEYMALGIPTVTSSLGLEGIAAKPGVEILVADDPSDYCDQLLALFSNPSLQSAISKRARLFVEDHHDWGAVLSPLISAVDMVVGHSRHIGSASGGAAV